MKRFSLAIAVLISLCGFSLFIPGCGSGSHQTLFLISAGTPSVGALDIGGSGDLTLNTNSFAAGSNPQVILLDSQHRYAFVLNNAGATTPGGVLQYSINKSQGTLSVVQAPVPPSNVSGPVQPAPTGNNPLAMAIDPSNGFVFVANAGSDSISVFSLDQTTGALTQVTGSPFPTGSQPVSLVARGTSLFVANQGAATISAYAFDSKTGALTLSGTPTAAGANTTSIDADPGGKFLFVADGTANTITVYSVSGTAVTATSTSVPAGTTPSNVHVDSAGKFLYVTNSGSNNLSAFNIDGSGGLSAMSGSPFATGTAPSFSTSSSSGSYLFVANKGSGNVSSFKADSGGLTPVSGSPFAATGYSSPNGLASPD